MAADGAGLKTFSAKVDRADTSGLGVSSVKLGDAIDLDRLDIRLNGGLLESILVDGLDVRAVLTDGGVALPGLFRKKPARTDASPFPAIPFVTSDFAVRVKNSRISLAPLNAAGERKPKLDFPFDLTAKLGGDSAEFALDSVDSSFASGGNAFSAGKISFSGRADGCGKNADIALSAEIIAASAKLGPLNISRVALNAPLFLVSRPKTGLELAAPPADAKPGRFFIGAVRFKRRRVASADIAIRQNAKGAVVLSGTIVGPSPEFKFPMSAEITTGKNIPSGRIAATAELKFDTAGASVNLGKADKSLKGYHFTGSAVVKAKFERKDGANDLQASAVVSAKKITADNGLSVEDAKLELKIGGEKVAGSAGFPKGVLSFGRASFGNFKIDSGNVLFQLEPKNTLFVEHAKFAACGGYVESDAFRISADYAKQFDATFHCSKMNVADVLNALNIGHASGVGAVSGRIPLKIEKRLVTIDKGFLDSAPGEGGNIKLVDFMGPMAFVAGYAQLDIVREALKNFDYDWLRIAIQSNAATDTLLVKLMMSGAPAKDLPFEFDEKKGGFHLSKDPNKTAHFQKMTFEINFILPGHIVKLPK